MMLYNTKVLTYEDMPFKSVTYKRVVSLPMSAYSLHSISYRIIFTDTDYFDFPLVNRTLAIEKRYYCKRHWFK